VESSIRTGVLCAGFRGFIRCGHSPQAGAPRRRFVWPVKAFDSPFWSAQQTLRVKVVRTRYGWHVSAVSRSCRGFFRAIGGPAQWVLVARRGVVRARRRVRSTVIASSVTFSAGDRLARRGQRPLRYALGFAAGWGVGPGRTLASVRVGLGGFGGWGVFFASFHKVTVSCVCEGAVWGDETDELYLNCHRI